MSSTPYLRQIASIIGQYSGGGTMAPPAPMIGSPIKAATVSGPSSSRCSSSALAHASSQEG
jgi:hypothetical protein